MSVASAPFPCLKFSTSSSSTSSSSSSPSPPSTTFRFSSVKPSNFTIRSSQTDGPLRRPVSPASPTLKPPTPPSPPTAPSQAAAPPKVATPAAAVDGKGVVTLEFQRQKAKELQEYFKKKTLEEKDQGPFFGWIGKNEISNGRWAMFGFSVGLLTEYATGSDFVDQVKILLSNFGIVDLD